MLQAVTLSLFNKIAQISPLFMHNLHIFTNYDFMKFSKCIALQRSHTGMTLFMIRFVMKNTECPINLLQYNDSAQLMRKGID